MYFFLLPGMFPYVMLGTLPLFSYVTWPKSLILALPASVQKCLASTAEPAISSKCIYPVLTQAKKEKSNKVRDLNDGDYSGCSTGGLNIFYSGIENAEKDWVWLEVWYYPLEVP